MKRPSILAYAGSSSQTGLAVGLEFPNVDVLGGKETFDEINIKLRKEPILVGLPMWNSHEGEIKKAKVLKMLFEKTARVYRIWPKPIQFECLDKSREIRTIISVLVAETQCSQFISKIGAQFKQEVSTVEAYEQFKAKEEIDAVLCAPGQNKDNFNVKEAHAENPRNFTTFVLLGAVTTNKWSKSDWGELYQELKPVQGVYFGVQMPIRTFSSSEEQEALIDALMGEATTIDEIPRVIFVVKRQLGLCGLLIEAKEEVLAYDFLTEEGHSKEITVISSIGETNLPYSLRIKNFLHPISKEYPSYDFIRHRGRQTCFYACPSLDIVTHGFEEEIVEPVVKQIINKYFELYVNSAINCTEPQRAFFDKYKAQYYQQGKDFIKFKDIGL